jgi:hypothetical protein
LKTKPTFGSAESVPVQSFGDAIAKMISVPLVAIGSCGRGAPDVIASRLPTRPQVQVCGIGV